MTIRFKQFCQQKQWASLRMGLVFQLLVLDILFNIAHPTLISPQNIVTPVEAKNGIVVTDNHLATQIGLTVLKQGGNAIDAAVTIGFVMAVTYPQAGNLGGGGFMLIYHAQSQQVIAIDYRETAPAKAHQNMFLDQTGHVDPKLSRFSHLAVGVPGTVAGLALALEKYGTFSLAQVLAPAITLAQNGFVVSKAFSEKIKKHLPEDHSAPVPNIFFNAIGQVYAPGERLIQKELAHTLQLLAKEGTSAFYQGQIADLIVAEMTTHGGLMTKEDLANYQPIIRSPVQGSYRGYEIYSMSPPSSGGIHVIQILNILEKDNIKSLGHNSAATIHLLSEAMKRVYADRSKYLGDQDFVKVPTAELISKRYAAQLRTAIHPTKATASTQILPGTLPGYESDETTHYGVVDKTGNVVSNTYTLNFTFGSGIIVPGVGILLNNQMDDFSAKPGVPNAFGLIGGKANAIQPRKRMLSSMSPTIVLKAGRPFLVTGSQGGSRIISTVAQIIMNVIDHDMNIQEAVNAVRIHHQWLPDELKIEEGLSLDTIQLLTQMGHKIVVKPTMGSSASSILMAPTQKIYFGAADPRRNGLAQGY